MKKHLVSWLPFLFFTIWGGMLLFQHRGAREVWMWTDPIDPRDMLKGYYVTLRFKDFENYASLGCPEAKEGSTVYFKLVPAELHLPQTEHNISFHRAEKCTYNYSSKMPDDLYIKGEILGGKIQLGLDRFYVNEHSPLRNAQSGSIAARISINSAMSARLKELKFIPSFQNP